jgi:hypothetical protein
LRKSASLREIDSACASRLGTARRAAARPKRPTSGGFTQTRPERDIASSFHRRAVRRARTRSLLRGAGGIGLLVCVGNGLSARPGVGTCCKTHPRLFTLGELWEPTNASTKPFLAAQDRNGRKTVVSEAGGSRSVKKRKSQPANGDQIPTYNQYALTQELPAKTTNRKIKRITLGNRQAGGHWFEPSTAHKSPQKRAFCFPYRRRTAVARPVSRARVRQSSRSPRHECVGAMTTAAARPCVRAAATYDPSMMVSRAAYLTSAIVFADGGVMQGRVGV